MISSTTLDGNNIVTVNGTAEAGAAINLYSNGTNFIGNTTAGPDGSFSVSSDAPLSPGTYNLTVTQTTSGGASPGADAGQIQILATSTTETSTPTVTSSVTPTATPPSAPVVGSTTLDGNIVTVNGTGIPGATIDLFSDGVLVGNSTVQPDGTFSVISSPLAPGSHTITVTQTTSDGTSAPANAGTVVVLATSTSETPTTSLTVTQTLTATTSMTTSTVTLAVRDWSALAASEDGTVLWAVPAGTSASSPYLSLDSGTTWSLVSTLPADSYSTIACALNCSKVCLGVATSSNTLWCTEDRGATWTNQTVGTGTRDGATYLAATPDGKYFLAGRNGAVVASSLDYSSTASGFNFQGLLLTTTDLAPNTLGLSLSDDGSNMLATTDNIPILGGGYIYELQVLGLVWLQQLGPGKQSSWVASGMSSNGTFQAALWDTGPYLFTSSNTGTSWTRQDGSNFGDVFTADLAMSADGSTILLGAQNINAIYISTDFGVTFSKTALGSNPLSTTLTHLLAMSRDASKMYIAQTDGYVWRSFDGGASWEAVF